MNFDYRFPLFDELTQGLLNPLLERNRADTDFLQRQKEQIVPQAADAGLYQMSFIRWEHPKTNWYRQLIVGETFAYINELLETLTREDNLHIKSYLRDLILDKHLTVCLQKLGELISVFSFRKRSDPCFKQPITGKRGAGIKFSF